MAESGKVGLRASANKTLSFGLVNVPIGMSPLREAATRPSGKFLDPEDHLPVKQAWQAHDGTLVERSDLVKGYEHDGGFVVFDGDALKLRSEPSIDLTANVRASAVPAEQVEKSYLIWPKDGKAAEAFSLLLVHCRDGDRALIGETVENGTTKGFVVRYSDVTGTLVAQELAYRDSVRWRNVGQVEDYMAEVPEPNAQAQAMADQLLSALPDEYDWASLVDTYGDELAQAVEDAANGIEPEAVPAAERQAKADDLMALLAASVAGEAV